MAPAAGSAGGTASGLLGVARKTVANERRSGRRRTALADVLRAQESAGRGDEESRSELFRSFAEAFERLSETDRELLSLVAWEGLTAREAARVIGIAHAACRVRLHRARRRLACELGRDAGEQSSAVVPKGLEMREEML